MSEWTRWLSPIDPAELSDDLCSTTCDALANKLWAALADDSNSVDPNSVVETLAHLSRLISAPLPAEGALSTAVMGAAVDPTTEADAISEIKRLRQVQQFASAGLLHATSIAADVGARLTASLGAAIAAPQAADSSLIEWTGKATSFVAEHAEPDSLQSVADAFAASSWYLADQGEVKRLQLAIGGNSRSPDLASSFTAADVARMARTDGDELDSLAADRSRQFEPAPADAYVILDALFDRRPERLNALKILEFRIDARPEPARRTHISRNRARSWSGSHAVHLRRGGAFVNR